MERTLISWNLPNWITIVLMATAWWAILGLGAQLFQRQGLSSGGSGGY